MNELRLNQCLSLSSERRPPSPIIGEKGKYSPYNPEQRNSAFTLAEVLITLGIIGVVAAMTLPSLIQINKQRAWDQQKAVFEQKFREATSQMRVFSVLNGHPTTEAFVKELNKYMKFAKQCDNSKIKDCYAPKMILGAEDEVEVSDLTSSGNLGHDDYNTNTMGLVVLDGVSVIIAYDPKCEFIDPADTTKSTMSCISIVYDINGRGNPNQIGKDIVTWNATITTCDLKVDGLCMTGGDIEYKPISEAPHSNNNNDWAGARKACSDMGMRLPTMSELAKMASNQYNKPIGAKHNVSEITIDPTSKLNMSGRYWSIEQESGTGNVANRFFNSTNTGWGYYSRRGGGGKVRCVK